MSTNSSIDISSSNFILKGITSILIGVYVFVGGYFIKTILEGFLIDDSTFGMLSAEIIEILFIGIAILVLVFSTLALYFSGRRNAKKTEQKLWNPKTKNTFWRYLIGVFLIFCVLLFLMNQGFINYITPIFLIMYGLLLLLLKNKARKNILVLVALCILLGVFCFLIPSYWYSSICIIGISHITYGVVVKS